MAILTQYDYKQRYGTKNLEALLFDINTDEFDGIIQGVHKRIELALSTHYTTPLVAPDGSALSQVPVMIREIALPMLHYKLHRTEMPDLVQAEYNEAVSMLNKLANLEMPLDEVQTKKQAAELQAEQDQTDPNAALLYGI